MSVTRPEVLSAAREPGGVTLELRVPPQLHYFEGHFPGRPILPGVVQLAWAAALGSEHLQATGPLSRMEAIKFSRVVRPEARLSLRLEWSAPRQCLSFQFSEQGAPCSSGRFVFAA